MKSRNVIASVLVLLMMAAVVRASGFLWAWLTVPDYEMRSIGHEIGLRIMPLAIVRHYTFRMECEDEARHHIVTIADRDAALAFRYVRDKYRECTNIVLDHSDFRTRGH